MATPDSMAALRCRENSLHPGELLGGLEYGRLFYRSGFHEAIMVQLGQNRTHAVIPKPSCVVGGRNKAAAQRVHFCQRTDLSGITEIIGEFFLL